ncbi:hypothetical protein GW17_00061914, partial [Ensete ventricosum]
SIIGSQHNIPFIVSGKGPESIPQTSEYKRTGTIKMSIYLKHMRNNEKYMCQYETVRCKHKLSHRAFG